MKKLLIGFGIIAILVGALIFFKDMFLKTTIEKGVQKATGLGLTMEGFRAGIINSDVEIRDLKLTNPPDFKDKYMIDAPEIYVDYDMPALLKGETHLTEVRIHIREFVVEKNSGGRLNLDKLKTVAAKPRGGGGPSSRIAGPPVKMPPLKIDRLHLKIGRVVYRDYATPIPVVKKFDLNIDQEFTDITDLSTVVNLIVVKALSDTNIAALSGFNLGAAQSAVAGSLALAQNAAMEAVQATLAETGTVGGDAAEVVTTTTQKLTEMLKNPFAEKE